MGLSLSWMDGRAHHWTVVQYNPIFFQAFQYVYQ